jgi:hypothetical protein
LAGFAVVLAGFAAAFAGLAVFAADFVPLAGAFVVLAGFAAFFVVVAFAAFFGARAGLAAGLLAAFDFVGAARCVVAFLRDAPGIEVPFG